jgi:hypothetical protein
MTYRELGSRSSNQRSQEWGLDAMQLTYVDRPFIYLVDSPVLG